ncbi:protein-L-isoaspartate O-methyltransferase family protein [Solicola gregarius]|uniref:Protein-L-isoaspartate O-methyltransferase n=1 Tax=Solicola gregarius TaxID=2908642 RepID=A0AA46TH22_9ACTN|nr:protein-L-isoaspartate O-methyltransferase [Solicola gregarius]UYM05000.1 protein-L-isoaspartate O-methyltransferase [Solicola gregarius]
MDVRAVADAMRAMDRREFLPKAQRPWAGEDRPLAIGGGQTNSQPTTVLNQIVLLDVREGARVLDVGAGSGWTTAIVAYLVGATGQVIGVEIDEAIAAWGGGNVARRGMPWAEYHRTQEGVLGWPDEAPYDRILVSAEARTIPPPLVDQLGDDGTMVVVVNGVMLRVRREHGSEPTVTEHGHYRFVPLR